MNRDSTEESSLSAQICRIGPLLAQLRSMQITRNWGSYDDSGWMFGTRPTNDVKRSETREWHGSLADVPVQANRALQYLKAAFQWRLAQSSERPGKRADARNPCWGVALYPERPRSVRLELAELPKLEAAIGAQTDDIYLRTFLRFVLATGRRRSEVLELRPQDVTINEATGVVVFRVRAGHAASDKPLL